MSIDESGTNRAVGQIKALALDLDGLGSLGDHRYDNVHVQGRDLLRKPSVPHEVRLHGPRCREHADFPLRRLSQGRPMGYLGAAHIRARRWCSFYRLLGCGNLLRSLGRLYYLSKRGSKP